MRLIEEQLPHAKAFYEAQTEDVRARIDHRLEAVSPDYRDKAFVSEVLLEMNRQNRQVLTSPRPAVGMSAG